MKIHFDAAQYAYCNWPAVHLFPHSSSAPCSWRCWQTKKKRQAKLLHGEAISLFLSPQGRGVGWNLPDTHVE